MYCYWQVICSNSFVMKYKMQDLPVDESTETTVAQLLVFVRYYPLIHHLQPLVRSQVTGVRYYDEANGEFIEDVLGL